MRRIRWARRGAAASLAALVIMSAVANADAAETRAGADPLQEGIAAYRSGAPLRALAVFLRLARARPKSALPAIWAGIAATAAGKIQEADAYFHDGLRRPHSIFQERITLGWLRKLGIFREPAPAWGGTPKGIATLARASNPRLTPEQASWIGAHLVAAARRGGLDPWLLAAVVYIESRFDHASSSSAGATGLGQLMPATARAASVDPKDPWGNLLGTAIVLRGYYREFGSWALALAAYNAGDGAVRRYGGIPPFAETRWYVNAVWTMYLHLRPNG